MPAHGTASDLVLRPISGPEEIDLFTALPYTINHELADDLAEDRRRPGWMWLALRGERVVARLAWWARTGTGEPVYLDILDVDDSDPDAGDAARALYAKASAAVLPEGTTPPEYERFVPADWREDPAARRAVETRMSVLESAGARLTVERLRLEWRPGTELPPRDPRLAFRPALDDAELLALQTRTLEGTLDFHSQDDLKRMTPAEAAQAQWEEEFARYTTPREWWQIATLADTGEAVGFVIPAHNGYNPVLAYIGVVPEHRGKGYIHGILGEGTRILAAQDVPRIRAATDLGNVPMANAFVRAGYVNFERAINMAWA
ncbi:GNAT family N-acetyltransferase [Streptomyces indicus]|uniref:Acetyltransferase (GNAT) domain-containing protein n=1 Tax=Streptomyces indicus TaxID=417292 RepID=A0A1G8V7E8_9ACTN|nr:GNAT family N-acetyltransferase [Streptomyces indicus]SDJ61255.1 Acetyltransferase (GNAT) domain-containing protein [Streptomyces indicus]